MAYLWQAGSEPKQQPGKMPGIMGAMGQQQAMRKQGGNGMLGPTPMAPPQAQGGEPMFAEAARSLLLQDKELREEILPQVMALQKQKATLTKLMGIGAKMGEDVESIAPLMQYIEQQQKDMERTILAKAQVPSKAKKSKPDVPAPRVTP